METCDIERLKEITNCPWCGSDRIDLDCDDNLKDLNRKSCDVCSCAFTVADGEVKVL